MSRTLTRITSALLVITAFTAALSLAGSAALAAPAQVLIIRHGEKSDSGSGLSDSGQERAQALVGYFQNNPAVTRFGTPAAIYAMSPTNDDEAGLRPMLTVTPLANALGITVNDQYAREDVQTLSQSILSNAAYDGKMVLVCWEHKMIAPMAASFGVKPQPDNYDKNEYGQIWEIDFSNNQVIDFRQYEEMLNLPSLLLRWVPYRP
jgi:hypothetical protein